MTTTDTPTIAFIGAGNMATSLIGGMAENGFKGKILASDTDADKLSLLHEKFGVVAAQDNAKAVAEADVVVLAVKPQVMKQVCTQLADAAQFKKPLFVSIAAGLESNTLIDWLGGDLAMVRCMPNTPSLLQTGASGLFANDQVTEHQKQWVQSLFDAVGITVWVPQEEQLHAITAVSGSGPAYFFLFMEAMQKAGESLGLPSDVAAQLTAQTALGAAKMVQQTEDSAAELRQKVCSPNGTTERAVKSFEQDGLRDAVHRAMLACSQRSEELAKELAK